MRPDSQLTQETPYIVERTDFAPLLDCPMRIRGGALAFCLKGRATITIDLKEYTITPDTEMVLLPDSTLMLVDADDDFEVALFAFSRQLFVEAHYRLDSMFIRYLWHHPVYRHSPETADFSRKLFDVIAATYADTGNRFRTAIIANYLRNILLMIYDKVQGQFIQETDTKFSRREALFHRFIQLLNTHCTRHREVEFFSDALCISKSYLASVTRTIAGETPKAIIDKHVAQEIKILLAFSDLTLQQIADHLNFPDQSYLGRYFKRHTGQSPSAYRALIMAG
ncbi:MAG: helix-turn-helix domain-containing protein [Rikenellaceae bacterium]|nr:helix-turn-helix domain-containing protein [Rikenellaceae bacterium]